MLNHRLISRNKGIVREIDAGLSVPSGRRLLYTAKFTIRKRYVIWMDFLSIVMTGSLQLVRGDILSPT